ncbi:MAG TPA: YbhN family protein [Actinoplanes sp.]|nr:YbhN family protein [Actinoplanes sp.]
MPVNAAPQAVEETPTARRWLRPALLIIACLTIGFALRGRIPDPDALLTAVRQADPRWLAAALLAQFLSQVAFAGQQHALLSALGVRIPPRSMLAITYSRSAISMTLPAGSAASAAFALRQYARRGADAGTAAAVTLLSAVASLAGLALLYLFSAGSAVTIAAVVATAALAAGTVTRLAARHHTSPPAVSRTTDLPGGRVRQILARAGEQIRQTADAVRTLRIRDRALAVGLAALNWLLDMVCLVAVAEACGAPLSWRQCATVYLTVQLVRQIPLTPGGIGLVEAGLLAGLVAAGMPESTAAAVVLGYRLLTFWLVLPTGAAAYLTLSDRHAATTGSRARRCRTAPAGTRLRRRRRTTLPVRPRGRRRTDL